MRSQPIKFFLDPLICTDIAFSKRVLVSYVADINYILAKNTTLQLVFNPDTDIIVTDVQLFSNSATPPLPTEGFDIWAQVIKSKQMVSYGGYGGLDTSGAGVLAGMRWVKLYDPLSLAQADLQDYWTQINNMLHELAHIFGAGYGEYYNLWEVLPHDDKFWIDFMSDPLLRNLATLGTSRIGLLDMVVYSKLTAMIISSPYRNETPTVDLDHITIKTEPGATVKVISISQASTTPITEGISDGNGIFMFAWGGNSPHSSYDFLRQVKVSKYGYTPSNRYISIYEADMSKILYNNDILEIQVPLALVPQGDNMITGTVNTTVKLFSQPTGTSTQVGTLLKGNRITADSSTGTWLHIITVNDLPKVGYSNARVGEGMTNGDITWRTVVSPPPPPPPPPPGDNTIGITILLEGFKPFSGRVEPL
jgi:hypothetical protein